MNNIEDIMAMAQNVQNELAKAQEGLDKIEVEGAAGGGLVTIRASAKGRIIGVEIDESLLQPSEKQMLEDLIAAAFNDAVRKAEATTQEKMGSLTSGLGGMAGMLPPGFKLPF